MREFTIKVPERIVPGLARLAASYNLQYGTELTVDQWVERHVREVAVSDETVKEHQRLAEQQQKAIEAAVRAVQDRLVADDDEAR